MQNRTAARQPRRVATIQDLSCFGRCSLSIALPVLSAAGVEACPLPTALLSTHTGGFGAPSALDLTDELGRIAAHWAEIGLRFDAVMTGYLAGARQIEAVERVLDSFKRPETLLFVDPAMADNGKYYTGFDDGFAARMAGLCARAEVILPNLTEAAFLLGRPAENRADPAYAEGLARALCKALGARAVVLTGVRSGDGEQIGAGVFVDDVFTLALAPRSPAAFHGAGDLFAAVLTGCAVRGASLADAARLAARFTADCIAATAADPACDEREGLRFEPLLGGLAGAVSALCGGGMGAE